jgi:RNA polymerase sigma-B factor
VVEQPCHCRFTEFHEVVVMTVLPSAGLTAATDDRAEQTLALLAAAQEADGLERQRLQDEVVLLNRGVAESIARRFRDRGESLDDLVQVAYVGLTKAVRGFDPSKSDEFLKYAVPTISGEVKRYFRDAAWTVRPPRRIQELQASISRTAAELTQELGRAPRPSELAERLEVDVEDVTEALASDGCFTPSSLDDRGPDEDGSSLGDTLGAEDHDLARAEIVALLRPACRKLKPRDQHILYLRFFCGWTQSRIAEDLGVTQMQVSRLLSRILMSLRAELSEPPQPEASEEPSAA